MSRWRAPAIAQATWAEGAMHIWGWNGTEAAPSAWLAGRAIAGGPKRWQCSPASLGRFVRIDLSAHHPDLTSVPAIRLDAEVALVWFEALGSNPTRAIDGAGVIESSSHDIEPSSTDSDSIRWFAALIGLASGLVESGRLTPHIDRTENPTVIRWVPVIDPVVEPVVDRLGRSMPPIAIATTSTSPASAAASTGASITTAMLVGVVDDLARHRLQRRRWRPRPGRDRRPGTQAARRVFGSLSRVGPVPEGDRLEAVIDVDVDIDLADIARDLDHHRLRLDRIPIVRPRLRLIPPEDPGDPWALETEIVDIVDHGRWCTTSELHLRRPPALDLAGAPENIAHLDVVVDDVTTAIAGLPDIDDVTDITMRIGRPEPIELDTDDVARFLDRAVPSLDAAGIEVLGPELLVRVAVRGTATPAPADDRPDHIGGIAWVDWDLVVDGQPLSAIEHARVTASGATLLHTGHRWVRLDAEAVRAAQRLLAECRRRHHRISATDLLRLAAAGEIDVADVAASPASATPPGATGGGSPTDHPIATLVDLVPDHLAEAVEPPGFAGVLRPYQRRGLAWLRFLSTLGLGGVLADDMGLGKTATTLAHLTDRPGPHLIVCPLSIVHNWETEAARFTPGLRVVVHHGAQRADVGAADLVITTYGMLARDDGFERVVWSTLVLDEAQAIKNPHTQAASAVRRLSAGQRLALTGTPVENRLSELWAIVDVVAPGLLGTQNAFRREFGMPIERHHDAAATERLRRLTTPLIMRRTKRDRTLIPDLPDKIEQTAFATLTPEQAVLYEQVVDDLLTDARRLDGMERRGRVLAALTRLKQICNHPAHALADSGRLSGRSGKLDRFDELVTDLLELDERALVFTQFREMGELLRRHLREAHGIDAPFLHGGVSRSGRRTMVEQFQTDDGPPALIVSLKAGGTGLNLTAATQVIHYDRWWNPAVEDQATDRAWRIGQHQMVNVHKLVCRGTIEERIGDVIDEKRRLADAVVGTGETWVTELDDDELAALIRLERSPGDE